MSIIGLSLVTLAAFADRPFHMDDSLYLEWSRGIVGNWLDPYAGVTNWHGTAEPMVSAMRNPPLSGWFLAIAGGMFGWSERALHLVQLVPCALYLTFTYLLARRWSSLPLFALAIVATSSAFLITGATIMSDCALAAAWMCAIYGWCASPEPRMTALAVVALVVAVMTKWYGLALVPLLLAWEILELRRLRPRSALLAVPLVVAFFVDAYVRHRHGASLLTHAAGMATSAQGVGISWILRSTVGLAFFGGVCAGAVLLVPLFARQHFRICLAALCGGAVLACVAATRLETWPQLLNGSESNKWIISAQLGILSGGGLLLMALAIRRALNTNVEDRFLCLWVAGIFVFAVFVNWGILARSFLPALPAVGIVVARIVGSQRFAATRLGQSVAAVLLCASGALGLALLQSDTEVAREARHSAAELIPSNGTRQVWFQGHWGFQHYAEAAGALPMDRKLAASKVGDIIVVPMLNTNVFGVDPQSVTTLRRRNTELRSAMLVLGPRSGAGFWSHTLGPLPFALNLGDTSETWVFEQVR